MSARCRGRLFTDSFTSARQRTNHLCFQQYAGGNILTCELLSRTVGMFNSDFQIKAGRKPYSKRWGNKFVTQQICYWIRRLPYLLSNRSDEHTDKKCRAYNLSHSGVYRILKPIWRPDQHSDWLCLLSVSDSDLFIVLALISVKFYQEIEKIQQKFRTGPRWVHVKKKLQPTIYNHGTYSKIDESAGWRLLPNAFW